MQSAESSAHDAALWSSAFRPFYLLGAAFGPLLMLFWLGVAGDLWPVPASGVSAQAWHGHEMIFGFAGAIIAGIVLTALPSWAGTTEIVGARLKILIGLWLAGRVAMCLPVAPGLAALVDCALFPAVALMLAPGLVRVKNRYYLLLLAVLAGLFAANLAFHAGRIGADAAMTSFGLRLAIHAIILLYVLKAGVLTPIFTANTLREKKRGGPIPFILWLDVLAAATVLALAFADLAGLPATAVGSAALAACMVHGGRLARWRGWRVADTPLLFIMHLGYAWLVVAFAIKAWSGLAGTVGETAWLHAFTVGALGMMMLGLMTRVTLRHTGRALNLPPLLLVAYALMFAAGLLRVAAALWSPGDAAIVVSALLWAAAFVIYLVQCASMLWQPSLPRRASAD